MAMMIHKITPSVDYNKWLKRLDIQLNEPTNKNPYQKLLSQRKRYYTILGTTPSFPAAPYPSPFDARWVNNIEL